MRCTSGAPRAGRPAGPGCQRRTPIRGWADPPSLGGPRPEVLDEAELIPFYFMGFIWHGSISLENGWRRPGKPASLWDSGRALQDLRSLGKSVGFEGPLRREGPYRP